MDSNQLKKGTAETLVLALLCEEARHGYGVAKELEARTQGVVSFGEGALYPALRNLEAQGYAQASWDTGLPGPARRVYVATVKGRQELVRRVNDWRAFAHAVDLVLEGESNTLPL